MVLILYMMYILYLNHGKELKAKALPLIWFFCVSVIKDDADGSCVGNAQYILKI